MILKASQRGGAMQLARHLLSDDNEHVTVHEINGFVSNTVSGAFKEIQTIAKGTQCKKFLFSLSLNPPVNENAKTEDFEKAIGQIEERLNIKGQPRCVIFHEKQGRRHAHCVWSRIDGEQMKAIKLPYYKQRLNDVAKELYLEHNWDLPKGFISPSLRDPRNFTLAEWQQAKRHNLDAREIRRCLQNCWKASDNRKTFTNALSEKGFFLAKGDRRGFVAVSWLGEIYSLSRLLNVKAKNLTQRLGASDDLPSVQDTKTEIANNTQLLYERFSEELRAKHQFALEPLYSQRKTQQQAHKQARDELEVIQDQRTQKETTLRQNKIRKGLMGLWDFMTGKSHKQRQKNKEDFNAAQKRDRSEKESLIQKQLTERQQLQDELKVLRQKQREEIDQLQADFALEGSKPDAPTLSL